MIALVPAVPMPRRALLAPRVLGCHPAPADKALYVSYPPSPLCLCSTIGWQSSQALSHRQCACAGESGKYLLKKLLQRYLPPEMVYRPKQGFGLPLGAGFRHELREEFLATLAPDRVRSVGVFCPDARASATAWAVYEIG